MTDRIKILAVPYEAFSSFTQKFCALEAPFPLNCAWTLDIGVGALRLYVGNLNFDTDEDSLRNAFSAHGTVDEVAIITDRDTGRPRGFAFVTMGNDDEARAAIENLGGTELDGRTLNVNEARERASGGGRGGGGGHQRRERW